MLAQYYSTLLVQWMPKRPSSVQSSHHLSGTTNKQEITMTKKMEMKIWTAFEMKCLRKAVNKTKRVEIKNEVISGWLETNLGPNRTSSHQVVHILDENEPKSASSLYIHKPTVWRTRRWLEGIKQPMSETNTSMEEVTEPKMDIHQLPGSSGSKVGCLRYKSNMTGFPAFQENKISWLCRDFSLIFPQWSLKIPWQLLWEFDTIFSIFTLIAIYAHIAPDDPNYLFLWTHMMN